MGYKYFFVLFSLLFFHCTQTEPSQSEFALGTVCTVTLFEQGDADVYKQVFGRIREIENNMSVNIPSSEVCRINAAAGIEPVTVNEEVFSVIDTALRYAQLSGGALDPTVGPLVSLWGIGGESPRVPSQEEIEQLLPLVNWRNVEMDAKARTVFLTRRGMALDLGAIAKGYAADEAAKIIKEAGIERAIIDLGGNIVLFGEKKKQHLWDINLWKVGIQNPVEKRGVYIGVVKTKALSIVTSGIYERFFEEGQTRYHHIFSPFNGYPAQSGLLSVTITAENSIDADALSTAVFVLGYEKGLALVETLDETEAIFIFDDMSIKTTEAMKGLQL